jgi:hypothetical protein
MRLITIAMKAKKPTLLMDISLVALSLCAGISSVKYLSKNTLKYYLSSFLVYLYFTIHIFGNFYFSIPKENKFTFYSHTFSLTPKSTCYILTGKWSNSQTYQENIPGHHYCLWSGGLTKHKCFVCILCVSVGVCPGYPSIKKTYENGPVWFA